MRLFLVFLFQKHFPPVVQFLHRMHMRCMDLCDELIHFLVEFFNFSLGLARTRFCMGNPDAQFCTRFPQMGGCILGSVVQIRTVKSSCL